MMCFSECVARREVKPGKRGRGSCWVCLLLLCWNHGSDILHFSIYASLPPNGASALCLRIFPTNSPPLLHPLGTPWFGLPFQIGFEYAHPPPFCQLCNVCCWGNQAAWRRHSPPFSTKRTKTTHTHSHLHPHPSNGIHSSHIRTEIPSLALHR